ncbi:MAG: class I SAM-dependent methyltransferase, partial [Planctomycetota bacterium]
ANASLKRYYASEAERRDHTRAMFDQGAAGYDRAEWLTGMGSGAWYRRRVLQRLGLKPGESVLDVAIGTGLVAAEALKLIGPQGELVGLDPSPGMLAEARAKVDIQTLEGYAEDIPLEDNRFDALTMGYALRHLGSLEQAFGEYLRVLKPGGRVCLMEIAQPRFWLTRQIVKGYVRYLVPAIARLAGEKPGVAKLWRYYWDTIQTCIDTEAILQALRDAGFEDVRVSKTFGIFREYLGRKPEDPAS